MEEKTEFLRSLNKGDFLTVIQKCCWSGIGLRVSKMIICYSGELIEDFYSNVGEYGWHKCGAIFMINYGGGFSVDDKFGVDTTCNDVRKPTPDELCKLVDAVRINGYRYNRKTKELIKL